VNTAMLATTLCALHCIHKVAWHQQYHNVSIAVNSTMQSLLKKLPINYKRSSSVEPMASIFLLLNLPMQYILTQTMGICNY